VAWRKVSRERNISRAKTRLRETLRRGDTATEYHDYSGKINPEEQRHDGTKYSVYGIEADKLSQIDAKQVLAKF
jgi:hypothetical protein